MLNYSSTPEFITTLYLLDLITHDTWLELT